MPIFMDRHDLFETMTAEILAQIHQEDLKIQGQFGCRGLTYWFDNARKTAFCLVEAPNKDAILRMHTQAHGDVPNSIIEVEASIVESFLGRIADPEKAKNTNLNIINDPAFRTIVVIQLDTPPPGKFDSNSVRSFVENRRLSVLDSLKAHDGNPVKQSETTFLVSFKSVSNAVHASMEIRSSLKADNSLISEYKTSFKIGVSAGVPVTEKKQIFEDTIKLGERMCRAVAGEVILCSEVKELYNSENREILRDGKGMRCLTQSEESFLNVLLEFIEQNWNDADLKIDDLGVSMGLSRSQLYRKITLLTGQSPNTLLKEYRLSEALKLLDRKTNNISQVAFDTGFTSQSYFSKCFQKKYGYSPSYHAPSFQ